jgi:hypothetical protein
MSSNQIQCANRDKNKAACPCKAVTCARHGVCCECIANHRAAGNKPACMK